MKAKHNIPCCLNSILEQAAKYEKAGNKELAQKWFGYAERYEEIMNRVKNNKDKGVEQK